MHAGITALFLKCGEPTKQTRNTNLQDLNEKMKRENDERVTTDPSFFLLPEVQLPEKKSTAPVLPKLKRWKTIILQPPSQPRQPAQVTFLCNKLMYV